jgi:hypothetical protein
MAWLIYGTPLDPEFNLNFEWVGPGTSAIRQLLAFPQPLTDVPPLRLQRAQHSDKTSMPLDFFRPGGIWVVSDRFKMIVQQLEPEQNQFFPVTLHDKTGADLGVLFHLMNVTQARDVLIPEQSDMYADWREIKKASGELVKLCQWHLRGNPKHLVARREEIGAMHLWRGLTNLRLSLFCSDELMKRSEAAGLRGLVTYPIIEE